MFIKILVKKVLFMSNIGVAIILLVFSLWPTSFISLFDHKNEFTPMAAAIFPILSSFVLFDVFQIVLSGALRGASDVRTVMLTRFFVCGFLFMPASYIISELPIESSIVKFTLIYGMFYISNGVMSMVYINRFRSGKWKSNHN